MQNMTKERQHSGWGSPAAGGTQCWGVPPNRDPRAGCHASWPHCCRPGHCWQLEGGPRVRGPFRSCCCYQTSCRVDIRSGKQAKGMEKGCIMGDSHISGKNSWWIQEAWKPRALWLATDPGFSAAPKYNCKRTLGSTGTVQGLKLAPASSALSALVKLKGSGLNLKSSEDAPPRLCWQSCKWEHTACEETAEDVLWWDEVLVFSEGGNLMSKRVSTQGAESDVPEYLRAEESHCLVICFTASKQKAPYPLLAGSIKLISQ